MGRGVRGAGVRVHAALRPVPESAVHQGPADSSGSAGPRLHHSRRDGQLCCTVLLIALATVHQPFFPPRAS